MPNKKIAAFAGSIAALLAIFAIVPVFAATTNIVGGSAGTYPYAWGSNIGWVNFLTDNGGVTVSDSGLAGYIWNSDYGWINLSPDWTGNGSKPDGYGVSNDGNGSLSGYAWGENIGWLSFNGITISTSTGRFSGISSGVNSNGQLNFDCIDGSNNPICNVITSWRPTVTATCNHNYVCDANETIAGCPSDCPTQACNHNGTCDAGETTANCSSDCPASVPTVNPGSTTVQASVSSGGGSSVAIVPNISGLTAQIISSNNLNHTLTLNLSAGSSITAVAVSENEDFSGSSWWPYNGGFIYKVNGGDSGYIYIKVKNDYSQSDPIKVAYAFTAGSSDITETPIVESPVVVQENITVTPPVIAKPTSDQVASRRSIKSGTLIKAPNGRYYYIVNGMKQLLSPAQAASAKYRGLRAKAKSVSAATLSLIPTYRADKTIVRAKSGKMGMVLGGSVMMFSNPAELKKYTTSKTVYAQLSDWEFYSFPWYRPNTIYRLPNGSLHVLANYGETPISAAAAESKYPSYKIVDVDDSLINWYYQK